MPLGIHLHHKRHAAPAPPPPPPPAEVPPAKVPDLPPVLLAHDQSPTPEAPKGKAMGPILGIVAALGVAGLVFHKQIGRAL